MEEAMKAMAGVKVEDIGHDFRPFLVIYKDGRVERFMGTISVPPSTDSVTGVESKDVSICAETGVFARLYKPPPSPAEVKMPVLVYFHGGGFCVESAASPVYHNYLNALSSKAQVVVVSVDYRRAPEHPLPAAYEDSWAALNWMAASYADEPWLRDHADLSRVFLGGDSAGANIAHHMAKRLGSGKHPIPNRDLTLRGTLLIHPFFWGKHRIASELRKMSGNEPDGAGFVDRLWALACPGTSGSDDPLINPEMDPELGELGGERVLVCVAEQDVLRDRGFHYKEALLKSGWKGSAGAHVDVLETVGENHVFHLMDSASPKAPQLMSHVVAFLNSSSLN